MTDSQYAVFQFDVKSMTMGDAAPRIFDSLPDAELYCREKIAASPSLGCRIYNRGGAIIQTFSDTSVYAQHHGRPAAKRSLILGILCVLAGAGSVALDAWLEWRLVFGVLLGVRFLWVGTVKTIDGISGILDERGAR